MRGGRLFLLMALLLSACTSGQDLAPVSTTPDTQGAATTSQPTTSTTSVGVTTSEVATATTLRGLAGLAYEEVVRLDYPIHMVPWQGRELVATKEGEVWALEGGEVAESPVLDISDQVRNQGERGLLSLAVRPDDSTRLFAHYSANDGDTVVSEFRWNGDEFTDERIILRLDQPAVNHNGGMIQFGPDGRLYLGLGDGGGANDSFGNGQNTDTLLGGLVAIDVATDEAELFSYGLRNPWRFWIDGGLVYIADVGQNSYEEVSVGPLADGTNYGWPITEGLHCFRPSSGCDTSGLTLPVIEVQHGDGGTCSITGGIVYRGSLIPEVQGHYFYSDYCGGYLRSFMYDGGEVADLTDWTDQVGAVGRVTSFGVDSSGEMYVLTTEQVLRLVAVRDE